MATGASRAAKHGASLRVYLCIFGQKKTTPPWWFSCRPTRNTSRVSSVCALSQHWVSALNFEGHSVDENQGFILHTITATDSHCVLSEPVRYTYSRNILPELHFYPSAEINANTYFVRHF